MGPPQIKFVFDPREAAWDQKFKELSLVSEANGGVAHVSQWERGGLGKWCVNQARADPPPHDS